MTRTELFKLYSYFSKDSTKQQQIYILDLKKSYMQFFKIF